jgi:hypothetical protein
MFAFPRQIFLAALALAASGETSLAGERRIKDPPGGAVFQTGRMLVVQPPNGKVPPGCDPEFRREMEAAFDQSWRSCRELGASEPSDCQRALFVQCIQDARDLQAREMKTCGSMVAQGRTLRAGLPNDIRAQKAADSTDAALNQAAFADLLNLSALLQADAQALQTYQERGSRTLTNDACHLSSARAKYSALQSRRDQGLNAAKTALTKLKNAKDDSASQLAANAHLSDAHAALLGQQGSASPAAAIPKATPASLSPDATWVSVYASGPPEPAVLGSVSLSPGSGFLHSQGVPMAFDLGTDVRTQALGRARPLAPGGAFADNEPVAPAPGLPAQVPQDRVAKSLGVIVKPGFTDRERLLIEIALAVFPACQRQYLAGLVIRPLNFTQRSLFGPGHQQCFAGQYEPDTGVLTLNSDDCGGGTLSVHTIVHEIGHRLDYSAHYSDVYWSRVRVSYPDCNVTEYSRTAPPEEWAEATRLALLGDSDHSYGGDDSYAAQKPGDCVQGRIATARKILDCR